MIFLLLPLVMLAFSVVAFPFGVVLGLLYYAYTGRAPFQSFFTKKRTR